MKRNIEVKRSGVMGFQVGRVIEVECDAEGTPIDYAWRRRMNNAKLDGSCEFVADKPKSTVSKASTKKVAKLGDEGDE